VRFLGELLGGQIHDTVEHERGVPRIGPYSLGLSGGSRTKDDRATRIDDALNWQSSTPPRTVQRRSIETSYPLVGVWNENEVTTL
jgi:hypothetical protein